MKSDKFVIISGIFSAITYLMFIIFFIMSPTEREEWWFFFKNRSATSADWNKWQEEKRKQQIMTAMSCQPEKPLSRGERYAMAMQSFWEKKVDWHFYYDDWMEENLDDLPPDPVITINEAICGIQEISTGLFSSKKVMTTDSCYPFKLEDYPTRELVLKKPQPIFTNLNIAKTARQELNGKKYDPAQGFLYQPQHYNQPSGFGVVHSHAWYVEYYDENCCQLVTYQELADVFNADHRDWQIERYKPFSKSKNVDYLLIKYSFLPSQVTSKKTNDDTGTTYSKSYLVNPCGELVDVVGFGVL